jgi:hypothetical protein
LLHRHADFQHVDGGYLAIFIRKLSDFASSLFPF